MVPIFVMVAIFKEYEVIYTVNYIVYVCILIFTLKTFYKDRKSAFKPIFITATVLYAVLITVQLLRRFDIIPPGQYVGILDNSINSLWTIIVFFWLGKSAMDSYKALEGTGVQPWIKKRIKIVYYSSFVEMFLNFPDLINKIFPIMEYDLRFGIMTGIIFVFIVSQLLAWVMPKWLKDFLNRNYVEKEEQELSEEELMQQLMIGVVENE